MRRDYKVRETMRAVIGLVAVAGAAALVGACSAENTPSFIRKGPDLGAVLDRTAKALGSYQNYLKKVQAATATDAHIKEMTGLFRQVMNMDPKLHRTPIGINLRKDASFIGFEDRNNDNVRGAGEKKLFKVEIDYHGRRLIATSETYSTAVRPRSSGFFIGILMNDFERKQRAAGIDRKAFSNRKIASLRSSKSVGNRSGGRRSHARSRARSGGLFGGK